MDIKCCRDKYAQIVNAKVDLDKIEKSIKIVSSLKDYEFRTTIVGGIHGIEEVKEIAKWLNNLISKNPKNFYLQGFKNKGKFIDERFNLEKDVDESYLKKLKEVVEDYFENVEKRV